uniref:SFRICE_004331 n=1 Tax=Spodoptera frugiperda TaxID=7108 RepID=A0A2H1WCW5_SPOFR
MNNLARQLAAAQRVAGSIPAQSKSSCEPPNCFFGFECHVHVKLYVCKRTNDMGENPNCVYCIDSYRIADASISNRIANTTFTWIFGIGIPYDVIGTHRM